MRSARDLAKRNVSAFGAIAKCDYVVTNSAGCGAALRELGGWLGEDAVRDMPPVRDVCELLDAAELRAPGRPLAGRVCYDDPCHLVHGQGVAEAPRNLLRAIPGLELVEHDDPASCCGAAGTYNLTHPEMSAEVLARKLDALEAADPDIIATGNPGCLLQLRAGAKARGLRARVVHPIELLADAYRAER
jgi:glycolate oxidase iron-sulfur subunit